MSTYDHVAARAEGRIEELCESILLGISDATPIDKETRAFGDLVSAVKRLMSLDPTSEFGEEYEVCMILVEQSVRALR